MIQVYKRYRDYSRKKSGQNGGRYERDNGKVTDQDPETALQHVSLEVAQTLAATGATREEAAEMLDCACKAAYGKYCFSRNVP